MKKQMNRQKQSCCIEDSVKNLAVSSKEYYKTHFRITTEKFDDLLNMVEHKVEETST